MVSLDRHVRYKKRSKFILDTIVKHRLFATSEMKYVQQQKKREKKLTKIRKWWRSASKRFRKRQPNEEYSMFVIQQLKWVDEHPTTNFGPKSETKTKLQNCKRCNSLMTGHWACKAFMHSKINNLRPKVLTNSWPHVEWQTKSPAIRSEWMDWHTRKWVRRIDSDTNLPPVTMQDIHDSTINVAFVDVNEAHSSLRLPSILCSMHFVHCCKLVFGKWKLFKFY